MPATNSNSSDQISADKQPPEFTAYFHLPHRRGRGATDFNFGRWVQHHSCDPGFPEDRTERYELWETILMRYADDHGDESTQDVDDAVRRKAGEAISKLKMAQRKKEKKVEGGGARVTVNKVVLKGVRAGGDINVNVGVPAPTMGTAFAEREEPIPEEVDIPPPPYVQVKDVGEPESGPVDAGGGDSEQWESNKNPTRKRPRSRSQSRSQSRSDIPTPVPAPESNPPGSSPHLSPIPNKQPLPQPNNLNLNLPTTALTSIPTSHSQKQNRKRPRTIPSANTATTIVREQQITTPASIPTIPNYLPNPNQDTLFTFRESLFTIHTQLTLLRGEVDRLRDTVAGLFQHEALAALDTLRDPTPASVRDRDSCGDSNSLLRHKQVGTSVGSVTDKDSEPSQGESRSEFEAAG